MHPIFQDVLASQHEQTAGRVLDQLVIDGELVQR
jgi:hypothetical protein